MSAASVQLVRLISFKTAPKRTSSGASSTSESSASAIRPSLLGGRRRASSTAQVRLRVCRTAEPITAEKFYELPLFDARCPGCVDYIEVQQETSNGMFRILQPAGTSAAPLYAR